MSRSLPPNPSIRFLRLESRNIIKAHRKGDVRRCETLRRHARFAHMSDEALFRSRVSLQDAQHALSLEYGFKNWRDLTQHINAPGDEMTRREYDKLLAVLQTSDDEDRQSHAIHAIGLLGVKEGLPHIIPYIESTSGHLQRVAVRSVIRLMGDKSKPLIYHLMESKAPDGVKEVIAAHFGRSEKDRKSIDYLIDRFQSVPDDRYRHGIAYMLLGLRSDLALPYIREDIRSGNRPIRYRALISLRNVDYPERVDDLRWILGNETVDTIRRKAVQIAEQDCEVRLAGLLEHLAVSDDSEKVRQSATQALAAIHRFAGKEAQS